MKFLPRLKPNRFTQKYRGERCLNCSHSLDISDKYCPSCGQRNTNKKINLSDLIQELFSSVLSYDSKLWQTIKLMFLKPGQLSLEYMQGKRTTYTNPFRFFLSVSVLFFLFVSFSIDDEDFNELTLFGDEVEETFIKDNFKETNEASSFVKGFQTGYSSQVIDPKNDSLVQPFQGKEEEIISQAANDSIINISNGYDKTKDKVDQLQKAFKENKYLKYEQALEDGLIDNSFSDWFSYRFFRGLAKTDKNIAGYLRYVVPKIPFFIFLFIPLFSIFYYILFFNSNKTYVDHLVFNFNLSSFLLLIFAIMIGIDNQLESVSLNFGLNIISNLGILFYIYKSIRNFYGNRRFPSFFKGILISFFYPVFGIVFLFFLMTISFLFY